MMDSPLHGYRGDAPLRRLAAGGLTLAISREAGGHGKEIGERAGRRLGWAVYDREALDHLVRDDLARQELFAQASGATRQWIEERLDQLSHYRKFAANSEAVETARITLALAAAGEVVLIGRGAGFLLPAASTLHVQIVSPPTWPIGCDSLRPRRPWR
jgi:hypothetical protein